MIGNGNDSSVDDVTDHLVTTCCHVSNVTDHVLVSESNSTVNLTALNEVGSEWGISSTGYPNDIFSNASADHGLIVFNDTLDVNSSSFPTEAAAVAEWLLTELVNASLTVNGSALGPTDCGNGRIVGGEAGGEGSSSPCWENITSQSPERSVNGAPAREYWALVLILFPLFTVFGNVLVILSVYKERSLQSVTNYFIVSLAVADLLVAALVMPFAVYVLVNVDWGLHSTLCDFYIAMDVICSTSSILNLVAISIDRYIAVTKPLGYMKHKNNKRVVMTIAVVWVVSAAIGSPIVLGLNTAPDKDPQLCIFYNADFIIYSSLSSFYIPCIIMVILYYRIFRAIHERARKAVAKKPHSSEIRPGSVIENAARMRHLQETALSKGSHGTGSKSPAPPVPSPSPGPAVTPEPDQPTTNTESGSQNDEQDEQQRTPISDDCRVIPNDKSTEFMLSAMSDDPSRSRPTPAQPQPLTVTVFEKNDNNDSGCAASSLEEVPSAQRIPSHSLAESQLIPVDRRNGMAPPMKTRSSGQTKHTKKRPRFTLGRSHKSSCKQKERSAAKQERKATKTLAIVLGVFLICWVPFFTCNIMDALCRKLNHPECQPSMTTFLLTTWLGYMNSFINPVIYTIFNSEFRKAFKKILIGR